VIQKYGYIVLVDDNYKLLLITTGYKKHRFLIK